MNYVSVTAEIEGIISSLQLTGRYGWASKLAMEIFAAKGHFETLCEIKHNAEKMMQAAGVKA
jgi:hypothetical protein